MLQETSASSKRCAGSRPRALCSRLRSTRGCKTRLAIALLSVRAPAAQIYAVHVRLLPFPPSLSLLDIDSQSYLRYLRTRFTRARCRESHSAWLLGSSTRTGRTSQKQASRASSSAQGHIRRSPCGSGATMRAGVSSSRRTMTPTRGYGAMATSSL